MDLKTEKLNIIKWLENVNDETIIRQFLILKKSNEDLIGDVTPSERQALDQAIQSIEAGRYKTDANVKMTARKKFPNLF